MKEIFGVEFGDGFIRCFSRFFCVCMALNRSRRRLLAIIRVDIEPDAPGSSFFVSYALMIQQLVLCLRFPTCVESDIDCTYPSVQKFVVDI